MPQPDPTGASAAPELAAGARRLTEAAEHEILVSAVSGWEISVKYQLGELELAGPPEDLISRRVAENGFVVPPVSLAHGLQVRRIPLHHRDPFDRVLIAQSQLERVPLISRDPAFVACDVEALWQRAKVGAPTDTTYVCAARMVPPVS